MTETISKFHPMPKKFKVWVNWVKKLGCWRCVATSAGVSLAIRLDGSDGVTLDGLSNHIPESAKLYVFNTPESDVVVTQFTGLKDKHGVEIYEGDIVRTTPGVGSKGRKFQRAIVEFNQQAYWLCNVPSSHSDFSHAEPLIDYWETDLEIIGNIFENADLLEANYDK